MTMSGAQPKPDQQTTKTTEEAKSGPAASDHGSATKGDDRISWWSAAWYVTRSLASVALYAILCLVLLAASWRAAQWVGHLLGFITGVSLSPITPIIAPLVFGLLAAMGIRAGGKSSFSSSKSIFKAIVVALVVWQFCLACAQGIKRGNISRLAPYNSLEYLLGSDAWSSLTPEEAIELVAFELRAKRLGVNSQEFRSIVTGPIASAIGGGGEKRLERLKNLIAVIDDSLQPEQKEGKGSAPQESKPDQPSDDHA